MIFDIKEQPSGMLALVSGRLDTPAAVKAQQEIIPLLENANKEITLDCTYYIVDRPFAENEALPIGIPFPNEHVFLLDEHDHLVTEPGESGEICVSGSCVGLGYLNNPDRTKAAFVQNPLNPAWLETIYRTGDLGRINAYGELEFLGRKDDQVKIMGHRVELGELEAAAQTIEGVEAACAAVMKRSRSV